MCFCRTLIARRRFSFVVRSTVRSFVRTRLAAAGEVARAGAVVARTIAPAHHAARPGFKYQIESHVSTSNCRLMICALPYFVPHAASVAGGRVVAAARHRAASRRARVSVGDRVRFASPFPNQRSIVHRSLRMCCNER